jgi:hypothetical protein
LGRTPEQNGTEQNRKSFFMSNAVERLNRREQNRTEAVCISTWAGRLNRRTEENRTEAVSLSTGSERLNRTEQKEFLFPMAQKA